MEYKLISAVPNGDSTQITVTVSVTDGKTTREGSGITAPDSDLAVVAAAIAAGVQRDMETPAPVVEPPKPIDISMIVIDPKMVAECLAEATCCPDTPSPTEALAAPAQEQMP